MPILSPGGEAVDAITAELQRQAVARQQAFLNQRMTSQDTLAAARENRLVQSEADDLKIRQMEAEARIAQAKRNDEDRDASAWEKKLTTMVEGDVLTDPTDIKNAQRFGTGGRQIHVAQTPQPPSVVTTPENVPASGAQSFVPSPPQSVLRLGKNTQQRQEDQQDAQALSALDALVPKGDPRRPALEAYIKINHGNVPEDMIRPKTGRQIMVNARDSTAIDSATHQPVTDAQPGDVRIEQQFPPQRDPLAQALEAERLAAMKTANEPVDIEHDVIYSMTGSPYVSAGSYQTAAEKSKAKAAAQAKGIPFVTAQTADSIEAADRARQNLDKMLVQIKEALPVDPQGRILGGPENTFAKLAQTNPVLAAFGVWRSAAIEATQSLALKGMGLRLNKQMVDQIIENDIPKITDDWPTAMQRVKNMNALLDSAEKGVLTPDRRSLIVPGGVNDTGGKGGAGGSEKVDYVYDPVTKTMKPVGGG